jgi:hypothetical protein
MGDLIFVGMVVGFFALAAAYVVGCERIVGRAPAVDAADETRDDTAERARAGVDR